MSEYKPLLVCLPCNGKPNFPEGNEFFAAVFGIKNKIHTRHTETDAHNYWRCECGTVRRWGGESKPAS